MIKNDKKHDMKKIKLNATACHLEMRASYVKFYLSTKQKNQSKLN